MLRISLRGWRAASAALVLVAAAGAQSERLHAQLAADPQRHGPAGLTWLRTQALPRLPGFGADLDPLGALTLDVDADGLHARASAGSPADGSYLTARLDVPSVGTLAVRGDFDGLETWEGENLGGLAPRAARFARLLGLDRASGPLVFDVAALVGCALPALDDSDPLYVLLGMGPAECGELTLCVIDSGPRFRITGRSRAGLLLPAVLCALADRGATPLAANARSAEPSAAELWIWRACCARDAEREEAARQLAMCPDAPAARMLERLLHADDFTRVIAMDALLRRRHGEALDQVVRAATPAIDASEDLAEAALWRFLPHADAARQASILRALPQLESARLRAFPTRFLPMLAAAMPGPTPVAAPAPMPAPAHTLWLGAAMASALLLTAIRWRRRRR